MTVDGLPCQNGAGCTVAHPPARAGAVTAAPVGPPADPLAGPAARQGGRPVTWDREKWRAWRDGSHGPRSPGALDLPVLAAVAGPETDQWQQNGLGSLKAIALLQRARQEIDDETQGWILVARGRGMPWEAVAEALDVTPQAVRQRWAQLEAPEALAAAAQHPSPAVRRGVAAHPATPTAALDHLADDPDPAVRAALPPKPPIPPAARR